MLIFLHWFGILKGLLYLWLIVCLILICREMNGATMIPYPKLIGFLLFSRSLLFDVARAENALSHLQVVQATVFRRPTTRPKLPAKVSSGWVWTGEIPFISMPRGGRLGAPSRLRLRYCCAKSLNRCCHEWLLGSYHVRYRPSSVLSECFRGGCGWNSVDSPRRSRGTWISIWWSFNLELWNALASSKTIWLSQPKRIQRLLICLVVWMMVWLCCEKWLVCWFDPFWCNERLYQHWANGAFTVRHGMVACSDILRVVGCRGQCEVVSWW